jgi:hypothetical protein
LPPDLVVDMPQWSLEFGWPCYRYDWPTGVYVHVSNSGDSAAGPFNVGLWNDGAPQPTIRVPELAPGSRHSAFFLDAPGQGIVRAVADIDDEIDEDYEDNNVYEGPIPLPTFPIPCDELTARALTPSVTPRPATWTPAATRTPSPTATPSPTPTHSSTPTASATVTRTAGQIAYLPRVFAEPPPVD